MKLAVSSGSKDMFKEIVGNDSGKAFWGQI
jgi:hypothetical protein